MLTSRTCPTKLATAPTLGLFFLIESTSVVRSKSSRWTEIFISSPGHRRKKRDLVARFYGRAGLRHFLVDRGPHQLLLGKNRLPVAAALHEVRAQGRDRADRRGHLDFLRVLAELFFQAGEEANHDFHPNFTYIAPNRAGSAPCRRSRSPRPRGCPPGRRPRPSRSGPPNPASDRDRGRPARSILRAGIRAARRARASRSRPGRRWLWLPPTKDPGFSAGTA